MSQRRKKIMGAILAGVVLALLGGFFWQGLPSERYKDVNKLYALYELNAGGLEPVQLYMGDEHYFTYDDGSILRLANISSAEDEAIICSVSVLEEWHKRRQYLLKPVLRVDIKAHLGEGEELHSGQCAITACNSAFEIIASRDDWQQLPEENGLRGTFEATWYNAADAIRDTTRFQVTMVLLDRETKRVELSLTALKEDKW